MKKIVVEVPQYQVTAFFTFILLTIGIVFLTGYFWGKKSALEEFAEQIKNESFSDKVYASLCSLYEQTGENQTLPVAAAVEDSSLSSLTESNISPEPTESKLFIAQLIGYGSEKQALAYVKALAKKGIGAQCVSRTSVSAHGKKRIWYQVVTDPDNYETITNLVKRLSIEDRLAGVSIVES